MLVLVGAGAGHAQDYDVVILGGRVMDPETMFDAVRNVGIKDGKIVTITKDGITEKETVDADERYQLINDLRKRFQSR
jgi:N-acyl-D-aspartate/D-glutamate deacylase